MKCIHKGFNYRKIVFDQALTCCVCVECGGAGAKSFSYILQNLTFNSNNNNNKTFMKLDICKA